MIGIVQCSALLAAAFALFTFTGAAPASAAKFTPNYCLHMAGSNVSQSLSCYRTNRMCLNMKDRQIEYWSRSGVIVTGSCSVNLR